MATLGDTISDAFHEWATATETGDYVFVVAGARERIDRCAVLLLCRLYEAGYTVSKAPTVKEAVTALLEPPGDQ